MTISFRSQPGEAALELGVERRQTGHKGLRWPLEGIADASPMLGVAERIEPDMRISGDKVKPLEEIELLAVRSVHGLLEAGLEAGAEIERDVGRADALHVSRPRARRREAPRRAG